MDVGGFDSDTLAEDADMTLKLERAGWQVLYESRAAAYTEAPATLSAFYKQRFRWMFGMLQTAFKHSGALFQSKAPGVRFFSLPNIFIFQYLFALISPVMDLMLVMSLTASVWTHIMHPDVGFLAGSSDVLVYWTLFQSFELGIAVLGFSLDRRRGWWRLLPLVVLQRFCYRQLLYWVAIRATVAAIKGRLVEWGKQQRTGLLVQGTRLR